MILVFFYKVMIFAGRTWLAQAVAKKPAPTLSMPNILPPAVRPPPTATSFTRSVSVALVVSIALAIWSLFLFGEANNQPWHSR